MRKVFAFITKAFLVLIFFAVVGVVHDFMHPIPPASLAPRTAYESDRLYRARISAPPVRATAEEQEQSARRSEANRVAAAANKDSDKIDAAKQRILEAFPAPKSVTFVSSLCTDSVHDDIQYSVFGELDGQTKTGAVERWLYMVECKDTDNGACYFQTRRPVSEGGESLRGFFGTTWASNQYKSDQEWIALIAQEMQRADDLKRSLQR